MTGIFCVAKISAIFYFLMRMPLPFFIFCLDSVYKKEKQGCFKTNIVEILIKRTNSSYFFLIGIVFLRHIRRCFSKSYACF